MDAFTVARFERTSTSVVQTQQLAERIGRLTGAGTVIALVGELGSGKTAFVQGLARGLQVPAGYRITSPSFTIINEYPGRRRLIHVDLYRIDPGADLQDLGLIELLQSEAVVAVEWAERLQHDLPEEHLRVEFKIVDDETRRILIWARGSNAKLLMQKLESK